MIKILFFIPELSEGGAEKVLRNLVNNMDQSKFDITVQTINEYDSKKFLAEGIRYKSISRCKSKIGKKIFKFWFRFTAEFGFTYPLYIKDDYDIEVAYLECDATKVMASSTNKKALKLAWVHCDLSKKEGMDTNGEKIREQYKRYDKIVCVSKDVQAGFCKLYGSDFNTVVLPNVIDEEEIINKADKSIIWDTNSEEVQLLAVGRLTQQKNFAHLIETCGKLRNKDCRFHLNILGEGPEKDNLIQQIKELGMEDFITLRGFVNNPYPWIQKADIIVCSSRYEGISTVVQEAMILGKAIVTTPCTGMTELLGASEFGMIVENSDDGLCDGLYQMIKSSDMRVLYGEKAKLRSLAYTKAKIVCLTQDFLVSGIKSI